MNSFPGENTLKVDTKTVEEMLRAQANQLLQHIPGARITRMKIDASYGTLLGCEFEFTTDPVVIEPPVVDVPTTDVNEKVPFVPF